ncbi:hypothetical protein [Adhaeribacter soli]|uniref:hypothetical protein n=1 Tax=Adhaeribacter soli TaxID=2607655 RepID=UPI00177ED9C1|nr:hypothetical protein [Adhaeribacter soli]
MVYRSDVFLTIYLVAGGILGGALSEYDSVAGGLIPAFLGVLIFFGVYFPIRSTSNMFKALILIILAGVMMLIGTLMK